MQDNDTQRPLTEGEYRVGINFNPSSSQAVDTIKAHAAALIDLVRDHVAKEKADNPEAQRCAALAATHFEDGAMWAVKAVTKRQKAR